MGGKTGTLTFILLAMARTGRPRRVHCVVCGGHVENVGGLSKRGKCHDCGKARMGANYDQIVGSAGPFYDHWVRRSFMASRRALVELANRGD